MSTKLITLLALCLSVNVLASLVTAAPTESTTKDPSSSESEATSTQTASAPATDDSQKDANATTPMLATANTHEALNGSTFTCLGRTVGYYADIERNCRVYHFCLLGEYNNEPVYQRVSYLCLNETIFDQQALDCVSADKITAPCKESESYYAISNQILREAIVGNQMQQKGHDNQPSGSASTPESTSQATSTAAPSEKEA